MKKINLIKLNLIPYAIILALLVWIYFIYNRPTETIIIPAKEGKIIKGETIYKTDTTTVFVTKWRTKTDTVEIVTENPVNDSLVFVYQQTKDSLDRFKLYLDAISLRDFETNFEDDNLKVIISGTVQGKLNNISMPFYQIKEREIEVEKRKFNLSVFAGYGMSKEGFSPVVGIGGAYTLFSF